MAENTPAHPYKAIERLIESNLELIQPEVDFSPQDADATRKEVRELIEEALARAHKKLNSEQNGEKPLPVGYIHLAHEIDRIFEEEDERTGPTTYEDTPLMRILLKSFSEQLKLMSETGQKLAHVKRRRVRRC